MTPAFLDANVFIYANGGPHAYKDPCKQIVNLAAERDSFMTSAEVFQEILHRLIALKLWDRGGKGYFADYQRVMSGRIEAIYAQDVELAAQLADQYARLSARDLIHLAVMRRLGITQIVTADKAFDAVPDVQRLDPLDLPSWQAHVLEGNP